MCTANAIGLLHMESFRRIVEQAGAAACKKKSHLSVLCTVSSRLIKYRNVFESFFPLPRSTLLIFFFCLRVTVANRQLFLNEVVNVQWVPSWWKPTKFMFRRLPRRNQLKRNFVVGLFLYVLPKHRLSAPSLCLATDIVTAATRYHRCRPSTAR